MTEGELWESDVRTALMTVMVKDMGMTYEKATTLIFGKIGPVLLRHSARIFRESIGISDRHR